MKAINKYINESSKNKIHNSWKKIAKGLSEHDKEWIESLANDVEHNTIWSMEELEQHMWKGDLKDQIKDIYNRLIDEILYTDNKISAKDIIDTYSLARTGKQSDIEVIAQVLYMINRELN